MKRKQKLAVSLMAAALAAAIAIPALAVSVLTIDVEPDVRVYVDDIPIDAGDTHGNPEAFIYNGTTYIAAAAVSKSLGENVEWEGSNRSVYIGKHEGSSSYLLNVCPPYQTEKFKMPSTVTMAGTKYSNCFYIDCGSWVYGDGSPVWDGLALFNLNGKYDMLTFSIGHIDGTDMQTGWYDIYLDDELALSLELKPEMLPREHTIPLNGALQMKIVACGGESYAFANVRVS